jgi:hypothetical protein
MSDELLGALILRHAHRESLPPIEAVIDKFASSSAWCLKLIVKP